MASGVSPATSKRRKTLKIGCSLDSHCSIQEKRRSKFENREIRWVGDDRDGQRRRAEGKMRRWRREKLGLAGRGPGRIDVD